MAISERLLTVGEAAERLGLKVSTNRRWISERTIGYVKIGRSVRIPNDEIKRIIGEGYRPAITTEVKRGPRKVVLSPRVIETLSRLIPATEVDSENDDIIVD